MLNESQRPPKFFSNSFEMLADNYLHDQFSMTTDDITHTNLKQVYRHLVDYFSRHGYWNPKFLQFS